MATDTTHVSQSRIQGAKILTPNEIRALIAQGKAIVVYKDNVLNLTPWLKYHPGGDKAVFHMVGRDATDEMDAYHSDEVISIFTKWRVGNIDYPWENMLPPIQGGVYGPPGDLLKKSTEAGGGSVCGADARVSPVVPQSVKYVDRADKERLFPVCSKEVVVDPLQAMQNYENGLAQQALLELPSLDYRTQNHIRDRYHALHAKIIYANLYKCNYRNYVRELVKIGSLLLYSFSFLRLQRYWLSALSMGMAWQQMTFIAHDAGHVSLSHNYQLDNVFGILIANWFGGLSLGWWKRNHNVHHLVTNDPLHDPDIQHLPFFAVSARFFGNVYSTYYDKVLWFDAFAKKAIPYQNYLYYPILTFGRFNLYRLSWMHLLLGKGPRHGPAAWFRYFEIAGLTFFFYWYFYLLVGGIDCAWNKFVYVMVSHMSTMIVHVQITLSHFAMSTADLGVSESFPSRQLRTTMEVDCPEWLDFLHGGLQFQAIHHLFPRLPRHNLRKAQAYVLEFCKEVGLPYSIYGFGKGNELVIGKLAEIGKQCSIMLDCTRKMREDQVFDF
ncbi:fatty acid/sphingolipid desaturase [Metschnikowia bicuspidata]|uniref:Delta 8-(E)-sphingolipid desaturase n=1 Tax=Metschnikowia bicuspidata TaxID=27322 RepID=A0A4P9ZHK5_9ASCO|nr:fatty acid/sphingolipid desaturase [Metschnikowia bicuspidata]